LVADAIMDSTAPGEILLDPFLREGTTLIAAERVERVCRGMEVDPRALDVAIRRWQTDTGKAARHLGTGQSFDDISSTLGEQQ
jgi:DNA modification methylase